MSIKTISVELNEITKHATLGQSTRVYKFTNLEEFQVWLKKFEKQAELENHPNWNMS